ncbi:MAG: hypothetical protein JW776_14585 [Candidatus Lokiarchaeota archaeon]|nr:hypothetical protein [Candidatus Lokiarchaeota archaeon]
MLRTSDSLAYLNKIKKAAKNQDILAAGYAVHDFQSLVARDLIRLEKKWNKSTKFLIYKEYKEKYDEKFADFFNVITNRDYSRLQILAHSIYDEILAYNQTHVPDFKKIEEIKKRYLFF